MIGRKIPREKPYSKENGRLVEFNETQMDEWRELGSHINRFFKVESDLPVTAIDGIPVTCKCPINCITSLVSPLYEKTTTISCFEIIPKSPCELSPACKKIEGVPVLVRVDDIFWAIKPLLPIPDKITLPLQE